MIIPEKVSITHSPTFRLAALELSVKTQTALQAIIACQPLLLHSDATEYHPWSRLTLAPRFLVMDTGRGLEPNALGRLVLNAHCDEWRQHKEALNLAARVSFNFHFGRTMYGDTFQLKMRLFMKGREGSIRDVEVDIDEFAKVRRVISCFRAE